MKFSVGYNQDIKLLDSLRLYRDNIEALYFPMPSQYLGSGRYICQENSYELEIPKIIKTCRSLNIKPQLLLNATCEGASGLEKKFLFKIIDYIQKLESLGLKNVIITNPVYIGIIKEQVKSITIESSVNCYVKTLEHAAYLKDLGVDILTIDRDINRNIPLIKKIKDKTGLKIKLMLNEGCLRSCPFRNMHYNYLSHDLPRSKISLGDIIPDGFCVKIYSKNPAKVLSVPFVPPDALKYYSHLVDYFKLSTRIFSTSRIESCLKSYINQDFNGDLLNILDSPGLAHFNFINYAVLKKNNFFKKMLKCDENCSKCGYCGKLIREAVILNPDFLKGRRRLEENKKAVRIYKRALNISKDKMYLYLKLARAYFGLVRHKETINAADKAIAMAPQEITGYLFLGSYYERNKDYKNALELYNKARKFFPDKAVIYAGLAKAYFCLKKYKEAIKEINRAIELNSEEIGMRFLLGSCYIGIGDYKKALEEFEGEKKINSGNAQINFLMAKCYRNTGQIERFNAELDKGFLNFRNSRSAYK